MKVTQRFVSPIGDRDLWSDWIGFCWLPAATEWAATANTDYRTPESWRQCWVLSPLKAKEGS